MSTSSSKNLIRLKGSVQQYEWGKQGIRSLAARLGQHGIGPDFKTDESKCYAEIWMGTHQNGPAHLYNEPSKSLLSLIEKDRKHYLGEAVVRKWPDSSQVPFLFKILSVAKALPLQVHPDRELAQFLHKDDPDSFVDANHKPEIAVAIGEPIDGGAWGEGVAFTGFVGFQPLESILENINSVPELRQAIGNDRLISQFVSRSSTESFKELYAALLMRPQDAVTPHVRSLVSRIEKGDWPTDAHALETARLVQKIDVQYPGDVGVLATTFFMNFVKLCRGDALYIGADEIHAYLKGDIVECMAVSDNVLNTAFVPPAERKAAEFMHALTFTARPGDAWRLGHEVYARSGTGRTQMYAPPLEEFVVLGTHLTLGTTETLGAVDGPTIGIVTSGKARITGTVGKEVEELDTGGIVFVTPGHDIQIEASDTPENQTEIWWAATIV